MKNGEVIRQNMGKAFYLYNMVADENFSVGDKHRKEEKMKEAYEELEIEVIAFDSEDVITTSYWGEGDDF